MIPDGIFTPVNLVSFRAYWWRLFRPIQTLARVNDMVQRATAAGKRIFEVLDAPDELPDASDAIDVDDVRGEMELRDVTFAYESHKSKGATENTENTEDTENAKERVNSSS